MFYPGDGHTVLQIHVEAECNKSAQILGLRSFTSDLNCWTQFIARSN